MYGICNLSIVPCRKEPSDKSELVTQLLFGEHFEVIDAREKWCRIRTAFDDYECWIDSKQFQPIPQHIFQRLSEALKDKETPCSSDFVQLIKHNDLVFPIVMGSNLPFFKNNECLLDSDKYFYEGHVALTPEAFVKNLIVENAYMYLNTPYLWGGRTPFGIDCSGFTQMVYKLCGIALKRDAYLQAEEGRTLSFVEEAEAGDLAFFDNEEGKIIHVGIILENNEIIHASGRVRVDNLDHHGIFNHSTKQYSHKLRLLKRVVE